MARASDKGARSASDTTAHAGRAGNAPAPRRLFLAAGFWFVLFVAYGSLVPLDFNSKPLAVAWNEFLNIPYLEIALKHREDFVANILLYIPIGLCFTAALGPQSGQFRVGVGIAVFVMGVTFGTVIEFAQLFFPPRTVSINDIFANVVGTAIGVGVWWAAGTRLDNLVSAVRLGGPTAIRAAMVIYVLAYLVLSLFPFDLLLTAGEIQWKLASDRYDLIFVRGECQGVFRCSFKLMAEVAAAAPLGLLMSMLLTRKAAGIYPRALAAGCALGAVIEVAQFFIVTGISQGISVLTRGLGLALGAAVHRAMSMERFEQSRSYLRPVVALGVVPYLLLLVALNGWFSAPWTDLAPALAGLGLIRFVPFYYHYYTTETSALHSLLQVATSYFPVGLGYWMWRAGQYRPWPDNPWIPAAMAAALAFVVEAGKLFVPGRKPDPTDILIAAFSACVAYVIAAAVLRWTVEAPQARGAAAQPRRGVHGAHGQSASRLAAGVWCFPILITVAVLLWLHPFGGRLAVFLAVYALCLWRCPWAALPASLALLPLLNFAPWTGWVLVEEFDLLAGVTVAVWLLRGGATAGVGPPHRGAGWAIALLAASYALSAVAGLLPFQTFDQSALTSYYGSLNSLRLAKGFVWALALLPMLNEARREGRLEQRVAAGVLLGLCGVVVAAVCQRAAMSGLLDFSKDYRIAATFPETHIGGGDVEAYLVMALPFAVAWIALRPNAVRLALGTALFALGSYALAVTFARAGYLAYAVMLLVLGVAFSLRWLRQREWRGLAIACGVALTAAAVMVPIVTSSFMQSRFAAAQPDGVSRLRHWTETIEMIDPSVKTALLGMGLGSYPRAYLLNAPVGAVPATFSYLREGENGFVRLGSGMVLYLDQRVSAAAGQAYTLSLDLRSSDPKAGVSATLCEKTEQHAFQCKRLGFDVKTAGEKWSHEMLAFNSGQVGAGSWLLRHPVVLTLSNPGAGTRVDVDNVSLLDSGGRELVANGGFSRGGDRWFFTTDNHVQWHADNFWVHVLFEQGWLGVLAFAAAVVAALARLAASAWRGDYFSATLLASLCGSLVVGLFNSLLDGPRVAAFFFLLLFVALTRNVIQQQTDAGKFRNISATETHGNTRT